MLKKDYEKAMKSMKETEGKKRGKKKFKGR